jgi:tetratricopeptide (TPR) repeat protein
MRALGVVIAFLGALAAARAEGAESAAWGPMLDGAARFVARDLEGAAAAFARARQSDRRVQAETALMLVALERGDLAAAAAGLRAAVDAGGDEPETHYYGAVLELKRGRAQAALEHLERAEAIGGDRPAFLVARAVALVALGQGRAAADVLAKVARTEPDLCDPRLYPDSGRGVIHMTERALAGFPAKVRLRVTLAQLYLTAHLWREAEAEASRVLAERDGDIDALLVTGRARLGRGAALEALEALDRAVGLAPGLAAARAARAEAYLGLQRGTEAEADLERAVDADPRDARSLARLATRLWERGEFDRAEELWGYALRRDDRLAAAHYGLAQALDRKKRAKEAEQEYRAAVGVEPVNPRFHEALALFLERHGRAAEAGPWRSRGQKAAALERELGKRREQAMRYLEGLSHAATRARAGDGAGALAALRGLSTPAGPLAFLRSHLAAREGKHAAIAVAVFGLPTARTFASGDLTLLRGEAQLAPGERVRATLYLPGVNPEKLR